MDNNFDNDNIQNEFNNIVNSSIDTSTNNDFNNYSVDENLKAELSQNNNDESSNLDCNTNVKLTQNQENKYSLKNFDNPYELLLAIMDDKKVDLKTVVLSEITDEYLRYIRANQDIDWDQASEFLAVAATLLEIKVKALLPKPEEPKDDEIDPEKELLRNLLLVFTMKPLI